MCERITTTKGDEVILNHDYGCVVVCPYCGAENCYSCSLAWNEHQANDEVILEVKCGNCQRNFEE